MFSRPVEVEEAGWVLVTFPPEVRGKMNHERDARIVGPDGSHAPYWIVGPDSSAEISGTLESEPVPIRLEAEVLTESPGQVALMLCSPGPGTEVQAVKLEWQCSERTAMRLAEVDDGGWKVIAEEDAKPDEAGVARVDVELGTRAGTAGMLLDLVTRGEEKPVLTTATASVAPAWLLFEADAPATYQLAYLGEDAASDGPGWLRKPIAVDEIQQVEPGRENALPLAELPERTTGPGAEVDPTAFNARWNVLDGGVSEGDLAILTLPAAVYDFTEDPCSRCAPSDVRLESEGRQVPFIGLDHDEPALMLSEPDTAPAVSDEAGTSALCVSLPGESLPMTQLELSAPTPPFKRRIRVQYRLPPTRPGVQPSRATETVFEGEWACLEDRIARCWLAVPLLPNPTRELEIVFDDGDNAPLPSVGLRIWRKAQAVKFVWPGSPVTLLAGNPQAGAPVYDLQVLASDVRRRPAQEVHATPVVSAALDEETGRALLVGALLIAGAALLIILAKSFRD
jgi:hypothetical protein